MTDWSNTIARVAAVAALGIAASGAAVGIGLSVSQAGPERTPKPQQAAQSRASTSAAVQPIRELDLLFSGDLLIHSPVFQRALANGGGRRYDFAPMFRHIAPYVRSADLAVCHVEVPMTPRRPAGYPLFNSPPALAKAIRSTGWDACDTASNHTLDQGQWGISRTAEALDRAGVRHTGSYRSAESSRKPLILDVKGTKIALLAYTEMTNGIPLPRSWSVGLARADRILADAARARRAGADAVIVNLHAGAEYSHRPSSFQWQLARRLTASSAITAVVGQHVHVVQPIRWVNGKPVVFGEGNLVSNQTPSCCPAASQDGYMAVLRLAVSGRGARVTKATYRPVWVRHPDYAVLPVSDAIRKGLASRSQLRTSWSRTTSIVGRSKRVSPR